jgi:hypothetical protein
VARITDETLPGSAMIFGIKAIGKYKIASISGMENPGFS